MRKTVITILLAATLTGCSYTTSGEYLGVMTGAAIGGDLGETIGWISSGHRNHGGGALLGRVVGTTAGAIIGHAVTKPKDKGKNGQDYDEDLTSYQTSGGYAAPKDEYMRPVEGKRKYSGNNDKRKYTVGDLTIQSVSFEDENGDGRFSKHEICNIVYEVSNIGSSPIDVDLYITESGNGNCFEVSPKTRACIAAHKTIRYRAKAYCKRIPASSSVTFNVFATSRNNGSASDLIRIKMK